MKKNNPKIWLLAVAIFINGCGIFGGGKDKSTADETDDQLSISDSTEVEDEAVTLDTTEPTARGESKPPTIPAAQPGAQGGAPTEAYIINELNFEVKKLSAEVRQLATELRDLQAKSVMWSNPLSIYSKEIILENGSTIAGKIIYQDEKILKIETLVGQLIVQRAAVVRIVENLPNQSADDMPIVGGNFISDAQPANRVIEPTAVSSTLSPGASKSITKPGYSPNVILIGTIQESKDRSGNIKLIAEVKNIGGRRADFVKMNFTFRKDWSGSTKTLTAFAKGSFHTFDSGITSDSSLLPGASGRVELYIPREFGTFITYAYNIDWEDY